MMTVTHKELDLGMSLFLDLVQEDPSMAPVVAQARKEYFQGAAGFAGDPRLAPAAEIRFLEWILFERDFEGGLLVDSLLPAWREMAEPDLLALEETFLGTCTGIFEVGGDAGNGHQWLRDIAGLGEYVVEVRVASGAVQANDLIVGRLFPRGDSTHALSPGAGCFREESLLSAVYRDLDTARKGRPHKSLKIRQVDLESMFWGDTYSERPNDPIGELRAFLLSGGLANDEVDGLVEVLSNRPVPDDTAGPFFVAAIQDLMDHLAFETEINLKEAQGLFLACWLHLHSPSPTEDELAGNSNHPVKAGPKDALEALDSDLEAGVDAETAFSRLSEMLGIDHENTEEGEAPEPIPAISVIPGLVEEYIWDLKRSGQEPTSSHHGCLQLLMGELGDVEVLDQISLRGLLLITCTKLCETPGVSPGDRGAYAQVMADFSLWCVEHHGVSDSPEITAAFSTISDSIIRVSKVNQSLGSEEISGEWLCIARTDGSLVATRDEGESAPVTGPSSADSQIRSGDFIRGVATGDAVTIKWCYPPELAAAR